MKIKAYLTEIKYRLFFLFLTVIINFIVIYIYKEQIIFLISLHDTDLFPHFISTKLTEIFSVFLKLSFFLSIYFSLPIVIVQLLFFLAPALYKYEYQIVKKFCVFFTILFPGCLIFTIRVILPYTWKFFSGFQLKTENSLLSIKIEPKISDYIELFFFLLVSLTLLLLCFFVLLAVMNSFQMKLFVKYRKILYFIFFILATLVTPPDITSQLITAFTLVFFYEFFFFLTILSREYKKGK